MERVWQREYADPAEAKNDIVDYIVGLYNCERLNSVLGNLPPTVFERNMAAKAYRRVRNHLTTTWPLADQAKRASPTMNGGDDEAAVKRC